jgi:hypothetical protein
MLIDDHIAALAHQLLLTSVKDRAEVTRIANLINYLRELSGALKEREDEDNHSRQPARHQT